LKIKKITLKAGEIKPQTGHFGVRNHVLRGSRAYNIELRVKKTALLVFLKVRAFLSQMLYQDSIYD